MTQTYPTPADRPHADVVIFDGNCRFCHQQVARLNRWDRYHQLAYVSLHDPLAQRYCPNLSHEQLLEQMYVVNQKGEQFGGAKAIRYLSRRLPLLWLTAPFLHLPFSLPVWQWLYRQIATRRYRLSPAECETGSCKIHLP